MLVLRKEIKIGIGAGLTILGIAAVYGLMASFTSSDTKDQIAIVTSGDNAGGKAGLDAAIGGLPPREDPVVDKPTENKGRDPFAESNRGDGNNQTDPWATALTTGRVNADLHPMTVVKAPTKTDSKLVTPISGDASAPVKTAVNRTGTTAKPPAGSTGGGNTVSGTTLSGSPTAGGSKYVVQAGDTFSTISAKVYGNKKFYAALVKANPDVNPARLRIGHEITVPAKEAVASVGGAIEPEATKMLAPIDASRQYRIASGDTLSHISSKLYGKSSMWLAIYEANKTTIGPDSAKLKVGTLLDLPQAPVR